MRTMRVPLVGTVMLALLGGLSGAVVAQMDPDADAVYVTGAATPVDSLDGPITSSEVLYSHRDGWNQYDMEMSDPRLSGTLTNWWNVDVDRDTGQGIMWGTSRIENADGAWEGPFTGMEYEPGDADYFAISGLFVGEGDYAGHTFYYQLDGWQYSGEVGKFHGVVYKGQPPTIEPPAD